MKPTQSMPWFKTWPTSFIAETSHLSAEETGIYFTLLCRLWMSEGSLPEDIALLRRWTKATSDEALESVLQEFFHVQDQSLRHARMDSMRQEALETADNNRNRAKAAANKRWSSNQQASSQDASGMQRACVEQTNKEEEVEVEEEVDTDEHSEEEAQADERVEAHADVDPRMTALRQAEKDWQKAPNRTPEEKERKAEFRREFYRLRGELSRAGVEWQ